MYRESKTQGGVQNESPRRRQGETNNRKNKPKNKQKQGHYENCLMRFAELALQHSTIDYQWFVFSRNID